MDIPDILTRLRNQRMKLVQTPVGQSVQCHSYNTRNGTATDSYDMLMRYTVEPLIEDTPEIRTP